MDHNFRLTDLIWCDNLFLFDVEIGRATEMIQMTIEDLAGFRLLWKPSSLQILLAGTLANESPAIEKHQSGLKLLTT